MIDASLVADVPTKLQRIDFVGDAPQAPTVENKMVFVLNIDRRAPPCWSALKGGRFESLRYCNLFSFPSEHRVNLRRLWNAPLSALEPTFGQTIKNVAPDPERYWLIQIR
jgi:hypothetical protein